MKKSNKIVLTLLSAIALAACGGREEHRPNPYDEYSWAGTSRDTGMMYTHYDHGFLRYYLISRMFDGFGYHRYYGGGGYGVFSGYGGYGQGHASAHGSIGRGGFGGNGMAHGVGA
jgi:hypothetical protein